MRSLGLPQVPGLGAALAAVSVDAVGHPTGPLLTVGALLGALLAQVGPLLPVLGLL